VRSKSVPRQRRKGILHDRRSVSPVIGTILVMAIAMMGIMAILFWGIPAINQMRAQSQFDAVMRQFDLMDIALRELLRSPGAARTIHVSANDGTVEINSNGDRWVVSYCVSQNRDLLYYGLSDEDNIFTIKNNGNETITNFNVMAQIIQTGRPTNLQVNYGSGDLAAGANRTVTLTNQPIKNIVLYVNVSGGSPQAAIGEFYLFNAGYISYSMDTDTGTYRVYEANGGTVAGYPSYNWIRNRPMIVAPRNVSGKTQLYLRIVQVSGNGSAGGSGGVTAAVLLSRIGTADETSRLADKDVYKLRVSIYGITSATWLSWLAAQNYMGSAEAGSVRYAGAHNPNGSVELALYRTTFAATITGVS